MPPILLSFLLVTATPRQSRHLRPLDGEIFNFIQVLCTVCGEVFYPIPLLPQSRPQIRL